MSEVLPQAYLIGLIVLLGGAAVVVARQVLRVRSDEVTLARLEGDVKDKAGPRDAASLYELASVQLRKRLFGQAADNLKQALRQADAEKVPTEARALIENALGFALAAQNKYPAAVRHYRSALKAKPDYPVALNNLAFALEKQLKSEEARSTYQQVLSLDTANKTARKRLKSLDRRSGTRDGAS
jgi:tetratricopeptide (TPR) repeat protein